MKEMREKKRGAERGERDEDRMRETHLTSERTGEKTDHRFHNTPWRSNEKTALGQKERQESDASEGKLKPNKIDK